MAKNNSEKEQNREMTIQDIKKLDSTVHELIKNSTIDSVGNDRDSELNNIYSQFGDLIRYDSYSFSNSKSGGQSTYNYVANALFGGSNKQTKKSDKDQKTEVLNNRINIEKLFSQSDAQVAALFVNESSDIFHICDEIESICTYLYQLDEAVNIMRDNIMNSEQTMSDLPFDINFTTSDGSAQEYVKIAKEAFINANVLQKINDHAVPKTIKFGRYYMLTIPYSEIGVRLLANKNNNINRNLFDYSGQGLGISMESSETVDESFTACMEGISSILDSIYGDDDNISGLGNKDKLKNIMEYNLKNIEIDESDTPPILGITEATINSFSKPDKKFEKIVSDAITNANKKFNTTINQSNHQQSNNEKHFMDAVISPEEIGNISGSYKKLVDPRQMVPIKIFDHILGYYYFENYDYTRIGTSITDLLNNSMNFNDQNFIIDDIVGNVLRKLKYGDLLDGNNDFKSMILNCILYAERRNNPVRIKFIPTEYVVEFKTNCDDDGNGQPVLMRSLVFGRLYVSLLLFYITTIITKSTDSEFYYLKEGLLSESYEDQVADLIEQFRNSNVDISQIMNGNLMHGNRAINKRYFMCTGTQDIKPFDVDVVSGQNVDINTDLLQDLKKSAIASTGVTAAGVDMSEEPEFATVFKMNNLKTLKRCNNIQTDLNPSIAQLIKNIIRFDRPNAIPEDILETCTVTLRKNNTINNNISSDELNNVNSTADGMIEVYFGGNNTETPPDLEYTKEEMKKRLVITLSPSLPWGLMDEIYSDVVLQGKKTKMRNDIISANSGDSE